MRVKNTAALLGLIASASVLPLDGQTTCIPKPLGVPGLNGPPRWWDSPTDADAILTFPNEMERFDDPRWRGAVAHTLNTGDIDFRAVYTTDSLFLSWKVNGDPTLDKNGDQIWVTLKE